MLQRVIALLTIVSLCLLGLLLVSTTPATAGPFGLLLLFISAYLASLGLVSFFLYGMSRVIAHVGRGFSPRKPLKIIPFRRAYAYSTVLATAPVMLIGLQSVGAIGWYELLLVGLFIIIGCVYVSRRVR